MVGSAFTVRRVAVPWENDLGLELGGAGNRRIEILDFEPQQDAVSVRTIIGIADRPMVVCDVETVQLEDEDAIRDQPLVFRPAVLALTAE